MEFTNKQEELAFNWWIEMGKPSRNKSRVLYTEGLPFRKKSIDKNITKWKEHEAEKALNNFEILAKKQQDLNENFKKFIPKSHNSMTLNMTSQLPIAITGLGDLHLGSSNLALDKLISDVKIIKNTEGMYCVNIGDWLQNFIHKKLANAGWGDLRPSQQWVLVELIFKALCESMLLIAPGNHDLWTQELVDVDKMASLAKQSNICYNNDESPATINIKYKDVEYLGAFRHKPIGSSRINPMQSTKNIYRDLVLYDFCMTGHHHEFGIEYFRRHNETRIAMACGSYKIDDRFGKKLGFPQAAPIMPTIILMPDKKEMVAVEDIRTAALLLSSLRDKYNKNLN